MNHFTMKEVLHKFTDLQTDHQQWRLFRDREGAPEATFDRRRCTIDMSTTASNCDDDG